MGCKGPTAGTDRGTETPRRPQRPREKDSQFQRYTLHSHDRSPLIKGLTQYQNEPRPEPKIPASTLTHLLPGAGYAQRVSYGHELSVRRPRSGGCHRHAHFIDEELEARRC